MLHGARRATAMLLAGSSQSANVSKRSVAAVLLLGVQACFRCKAPPHKLVDSVDSTFQLRATSTTGTLAMRRDAMTLMRSMLTLASFPAPCTPRPGSSNSSLRL